MPIILKQYKKHQKAIKADIELLQYCSIPVSWKQRQNKKDLNLTRTLYKTLIVPFYI